jgi:hypothetical protein
MNKKQFRTQSWWYTSLIPALREAETGGSQIQGQPALHEMRPDHLKSKNNNKKN